MAGSWGDGLNADTSASWGYSSKWTEIAIDKRHVFASEIFLDFAYMQAVFFDLVGLVHDQQKHRKS